MAISNLNMVKSWINYLQQDDIMAAIVGKDKAVLHKLEHCYIADDQICFLTESPLLGEAGLDFSVQLKLSTFEKIPTIGLPSKDEEFIKKYADFMQHKGQFYLECDTFSGDSGKVAFFVDTFQRSCSELAKFFEEEINVYSQKQKNTLLKILVQMPEALLLSYIGIMSSREDRTIRLSVSTKEMTNGSLKEQLEWLSSLGYFSEAKTIASDLEGIDELLGFVIFLTIDIMPDGTLGDTLGCELKPLAESIGSQKKMLESVQLNTLLQRLDELKLMDKRIWYAGYGIFCAPLPQDGTKQEGLYSMISHFKLKWKNGKHLPSKIYFCCYRGII